MKTLKILCAALVAMAAALTGFGATATVGGVTYTYTVASGMATITGVTVGSVTELTIPSTLGGYPVAALGADSFRSSDNDTQNITSVVIPEGVINIGDTAFNGCFSLRSVVIPSSVMTIGVRAFINCIALTQVTLSPGVMTIGEYAFTGCSALAQVKIPASVKTLGIGSFSHCESLASVYFDGDAPHVAYYGAAFGFCASDAKAYVNTDAMGFGSVGSYFSDLIVAHRTDVVCEYALEDGKATITRVHSNGRTVITLPSTLGGCPVAALGSDAFRGCSDLESVTIPSSVMTVGNYAFAKCGALASLNFDGNAPTCGEKAFDGVASDAKAYVNCDATGFGAVGRVWNGLETAYLPVSWQYSVTSGKATIIGVTVGRVTGVAIPATLGGWPVTKIGENAFDADTHDTENMTAVKIPEGVTTIGECAFNLCASLKSVTLPSSVTAIELGAFGGCYALTKVTIPSKVSTIGNYAFEMCYNLESVYFNGNAPTCGTAVFGGVASGAKAYVNADASGFGTVGSAWNGLTVASRTSVAYEYTAADNKATITGVHPNGQTEFVIPSTLDGYPVTAIGADAFDADVWPCANIAAVTISEGVTAIGAWAFYACTSLESVTIPASVETIGNNAFSGCSALEAVYFAGDEPTCGTAAFGGVASGAKAYVNTRASGFSYDGADWNGLKVALRGDVSYSYGFEDGEVTIFAVHPNGHTEIVIPATLGGDPVVAIGEGALAYNAEITSVVIPEGVKTIGFGAFRGCSALTQELTVDPGNAYYCVTNGLLCDKQVTKVIACPGGLTAVTIPEGVKTIGQGAFDHCASLKSVTIPASVETIEYSAFSKCSALESVTIPPRVKTIEFQAFEDCTSLKSVAILEGVKTIGQGAFSHCASLKSVTIPASVETIVSGAFSDCSALESVTIREGVKKIDEHAFRACSALTSVAIPSSVEVIGDCAFYGCDKLKFAMIPKGVKKIGEGAFALCSALASVTIPEGVETIEVVAFYHCASLKSVTIPASVETIGVSAFASCLRLTSVYFDGDAPTVGADAFLDVAHPSLGTKAYAYVRPDAKGFGAEGTTWNGLTIAYRDDIVVPAGVYGKWTLADLGIEPPPAGTVYSVKAYGLPSGLKLKYNAAVKKGKMVVTKAKTDWWIEGVPTVALNALECPMYLAVTVGKKTTWYPVQLSVSAQKVADLGTFTVGTAINETGWLPGLADGGWSVSGLPKGLKYTANIVYNDPKKKSKGIKYAADTTYGKLSAAGLYTITAKKKVGSYYETLKFKVLVNPSGDFTTRNFTAYETFATMKDTSWKKVSGLPAGLKFDAKKYTVSGKITKAGTFAVTFTPKKGKAWTEMWIVAANPAGPSLGFNTTGETSMSVLQGQTGEGNALTFPADGTVSVSGLPKGMKLVKNADGTYALGGVPSVTGTFFVTVKAVKNGRTVTQRVAVTVKTNPMAGTYYGYSKDKSLRYRTASLTIASSGKATMKYTEGSKTYTLTASAGTYTINSSGKRSEYRFVQKANTKKKIPARVAGVTIYIDDTGAMIDGEWWVCSGTEYKSGAELCEGAFQKAQSAAVVNAIRTDPLTGFAAKATYALTSAADPAQVIYATYAYSSSTGKFTVKGKLPLGKAFSATVAATRLGLADLELAPISAADADGTRYLLMLIPGGDVRVFVDGLTSSEFKIDSQRYDFGTGYTALPTTFAAAIAMTSIDFCPVEVVYSSGEKEAFRIRANGTKYFQVSFDEGKTWSAKAEYKYDKARGLITLSFTNGKTKAKYALDLLYAQPELLYGQIKRQSNPKYDKKTKKTTYTTEYGKVQAWPATL